MGDQGPDPQLHYACQEGRLDLVRGWVDKKKDVNTKSPAVSLPPAPITTWECLHAAFTLCAQLRLSPCRGDCSRCNWPPPLGTMTSSSICLPTALIPGLPTM